MTVSNNLKVSAFFVRVEANWLILVLLKILFVLFLTTVIVIL